MLLHCRICSCRELGQEGLQSSMQTHVFPPSKLQTQSPFTAGVFLGFTLHNHNLAKRQHCCTLPHASPTYHQNLVFVVNSHTQKKNSRGSSVFVGFKLQCHSKTLAFPTKVSSLNGKKKRYGGVLPSILRSLESNNDIEKTLNEYGENLSPKEQTGS